MSTATASDQSKKPILTTRQDIQPSPGWIRQLGDHVVSNETMDSVQNDGKQVTLEQSQTLGPTMNESWNMWLKPKATSTQIEYEQSSSSSKPESNGFQNQPSIHEIKKDLHNAEVKTVLMAADLMGRIQEYNEVNEHGFPARGEKKFNTESLNIQKDFQEELEKTPPPADPVENYLFERSEPVQEFKQEVNVDRPLKAVDFGFFFSWMFGGMREILGNLTKPLRGQIKPFFGANKNLAKDEIVFRSKKQFTPEQQATELKQNQNQVNFFEALKNNARMFLGLDRKRSFKQQIETTNQQARVSNVSYEGIMDPAGQIRDNIATAAEQGNSQKTAEQLKNDKQRKLMFTSKGKAKSGPGITFSADKSHNFNNAAKLAG